MATIAMDSQASRAGAKPPISLHPAFPAVVALWFAALLGFGSLVLPVILLETAVDKAGLAAILPAASPPLGFTARATIALVAALIGAAAGLIIARQLAQMHAPVAKARRTTQTAEKRRPISAHDELGDEGLGDSGGGATRRRSLAIAEDEGPSEYLSLAPLPGEGAPEAAAPAPHEEPAADWMADDPLELCDIATGFGEPATRAEPEPMVFPDDPRPSQQDSDMTADAPAPLASPSGMARHAFERPSEPEPLPFSAPSLARRAPDTETIPTAPEPDTNEVWHAQGGVEAPQSFDPPVALADQAATPADWSTAPLEGLGLVQLVQRLGASLEKRRELVAQAAAAPPLRDAGEHLRIGAMGAPPAPVPELLDAAPAEEAAQAMAAYFGRPAVAAEPLDGRSFDSPAAAAADESAPPLTERMAALAATSLEPDDDEEADDLTASFALPLRRPPTPRLRGPGGELLDPVEQDEARFGSLLSMGNPFAAKTDEFVRIEEPARAQEGIQPTVVFPGREPSLRGAGAPAPQAPNPVNAGRMFDPPSADGGASAIAPKGPPPADADEALRKALATLQRMSSSG